MDHGIWATWYDLTDDTRERFLDWLHGTYLPALQQRPGFAWAAHYRNEGGGDADARTSIDAILTRPQEDIGDGSQYVVLVGAPSPHTFLSPLALDIEQEPPFRDMLALRRGVRSAIFSEEARVNGPAIGQRPQGGTPGPAIQMGSFRVRSVQEEFDLGCWYAQYRLPHMAQMPGCIASAQAQLRRRLGQARHPLRIRLAGRAAAEFRGTARSAGAATPRNGQAAWFATPSTRRARRWSARASGRQWNKERTEDVMARYLKRGMDASAIKAADAKVRETVESILAQVDARKDAAIRELSEKFDKWSPARFPPQPAGNREGHRAGAQARPRGHQIRADADAQLRAEATRHHARPRGRDAARRRARPPPYPGQLDRLLRAGRALSDGRLRAHVDRHRARRRRQTHHRLRPAVTRAGRIRPSSPPMHFGGADDIYVLGGVQAVAAMALGTDTIAAGRHAGRPRQRLCGGSQAAIVRPRRHRPAWPARPRR